MTPEEWQQQLKEYREWAQLRVDARHRPWRDDVNAMLRERLIRTADSGKTA